MQKQKNSKFIFGLFVLISLFFFKQEAQAAVSTIDQLAPNSPAYIYNNTPKVIGITSSEAANYQMPILNLPTAADVNLFDFPGATDSDYLNDTNAIFGYAWSKRVGWLNFSHGFFQYRPRFKTVGAKIILSGYVWSDKVGWIQLSSVGGSSNDGLPGDSNFNPNISPQSATNWGVVFTGDLNSTGSFSGYAWGQYIGWIDFSQVKYKDGKFYGYACGNDGVSSGCADDAKIYFRFTGNGSNFDTINYASAAVDPLSWGVSKNMTKITDNTVELNAPTYPISLSSDGKNLTINTVNYYSSALPVSIGQHAVETKVTNRFGQTYSGTQNYRVLLLDCENPTGNNITCETPTVNLINNNDVVADGVASLNLKFDLKGSSGSVSLSNIDGVVYTLDLTFDDTVRRNQLLSTVGGDAVNKTINAYYQNKDTNYAQITSKAPTNDQNILNLKDCKISVLSLPQANLFNPSLFSEVKVILNQPLTFKPALTAEIYDVNPLIEGVQSSFKVRLTNKSPNIALNTLDLNTLFDATTVSAELQGGSAPATIDKHEIVSLGYLDNYAFSGGSVLDSTKILSSSLGINAGEFVDFKITPRVLIGSKFDLSETMKILTQVAYKLEVADTQKTLHNSGEYNLTNDIAGRQVEIQGLASGKNIKNILEGDSYAVTSGMTFADISEEIQKNVADITRNENAGDLSSAKTITSWSGGILNGTVLYYKGDKTLTIGNGSDFNIADTQGTIIVVGGDVYIKSNLVYTGTQKGSFGLIILKDASGNGGNVYIDPAVTNLVGGLYMEGSLMSATNASGTLKVIDGTDATTSLANQLLLKGTLISRNTIGGSRQNPIKLPDGISNSPCVSTDSNYQKCSERYDLNYLRDFTMSGTTVLNGGFKVTETTSTAPFVIEYDSRIQSNIPPGFDIKKKIDFSEVIH